MIKELESSVDPSTTRRFGTLGDDALVRRTAAALESKVLIINCEIVTGRITVVFVDEVLGF
jgi:hypothetical protein